MNFERLKNEFPEMPEFIRDRIRSQVEEELKKETEDIEKRKKPRFIKRTAVAAAVVLAVFGISRISFVANAMDKLIQYITYRFTVTNEDGTKTTVEMQEDSIQLAENVPMENCYMDDMVQAGEQIGVKLLASSSMYQYEECIRYTPIISEEDVLFGVMLQDHFYTVGDLGNVKLYPKTTEESIDFMTYEAGAKYQTPISMQVTVWTNQDSSAEYEEDELGYASKTVNVDMKDVSSEAEVYTIPQLNVDAVVYTVYTDGPIAWGIEEGSIRCTSTFFVYEGVEYIYMGGVSHDTMKEFLNTLE